jgi:hypothetical protein
MDLFLSDGRPLSQSIIGPVADDAVMAADSQDNYFYEPLEGEASSIDWAPLSCQPPSRWKVTSSGEIRGTTFYPISQPYGPAQTDMTVTFTADRTVTKSAEVSGEVGVTIGFLEAQVGVKLEGSVTTSRSESVTFRVPKGKRYVLLAQIIYRQTDCERTAYAGPNCQPYAQNATALTPVTYAVLVGDSAA